MIELMQFYLVGLGNPGEKYTDTRHNVGFMLVENFCVQKNFPNFIKSSTYSGQLSEGFVDGAEVAVLLPDTWMNNSGSSVKKLVPKNNASNLIVVYDDVDLPIGEYKLSFGRGDGGHNGIKSIVKELGTKDFVRLRVGIAPRSFWTGKVRRPQAAALPRHVLGKFTKKELTTLDLVKEQTVEIIEAVFNNGVVAAMNKYN